MNYKLNDRETMTLYYIPRKLKWYEKILQKLHIKNYYKKISSGVLEYKGSE